MSDELGAENDEEIQTQLILLAAANHDVESLRSLLRKGSASAQDPETGFTPLHSAIAALEDAPDSPANLLNENAVSVPQRNGRSDAQVEGKVREDEAADIEAAAKTMKLLLQNGAIWNDIDRNDETPGCLALRLGLKELYEIMVDAGVRAEMLLARLDEYEALNDGDETGSEQELNGGQEVLTDSSNGHAKEGANGDAEVAAETIPDQLEAPSLDGPRNEDYLQSVLRFQDGRILDNAGNGVMMAWEADIMKRTADVLCPKSGLRVLNVGHGMGIIDQFLQNKSPSAHHIIEAHPAVISRMEKDGWHKRSNVTVHKGRWQDVVPKIIQQGILFDAIYFDTFAEDYKALRDFFSDCLIGLLDDSGKWGFFNGLGADRQVCYDVYTKIVEMDLFETGFDTEWQVLQVPEMEHGEWEGVKRRYWTLREYKLPVCSFIE